MGESTYDLTDRKAEGYRGRWRYRVTEYGGGRVGFKLLFRRRGQAAKFAAQCRTFGAEMAAKHADISGWREGVDFRSPTP